MSTVDGISIAMSVLAIAISLFTLYRSVQLGRSIESVAENKVDVDISPATRLPEIGQIDVEDPEWNEALDRAGRKLAQRHAERVIRRFR